MRVPAHKLPKQNNKVSRSVKHKDSAKAKARKEKKEEKVNAMSEDAEPVVQLSEAEKEAAKAERKKANAHKVAYKKQMLHMSGRNGPRAVNSYSITPTHGF